MGIKLEQEVFVCSEVKMMVIMSENPLISGGGGESGEY
jgi:hypothetical protein